MTFEIDWERTYAAIWRGRQAYLKPVNDLDTLTLESLFGLEEQKKRLLQNTTAFIRHKDAAHTLLWGARGTGKSSLIKALLNTFKNNGLRIVEIDKDDLADLPYIADALRDLPYRFILFLDDLSFETGDNSYKSLKTVMEGSIEAPPQNIKIYATSNRRHLIPEYKSENDETRLGEDGEIHYGDSVEEKISLSDRFGLWVSFYSGNLNEYLKIVDFYFKDYSGDREKLHKEAVHFADSRGARSGRTAKQFYQNFTH